MNYRFKRRAFFSALGGALGLETMLGNLEASAAGAPSPARLLVGHWPMGTMRHYYLPQGDQRGFTMPRLLSPFEQHGLREDLAILFGLTHTGIDATYGGGHEAGTVMMMTGAATRSTRDNGGEADDSMASGPSFDQIFLRHAAALQRPMGMGYANAIADARVDSYETSTQCLSYSHETRMIESALPAGLVTENVPLMPALHPVHLYMQVFEGFTPGGGDPEGMVQALRLKRSVLDSSLRELSRLNDLAPASERDKIEIHTEAIRKVERQLATLLDTPGACVPPFPPDASLQGLSGSRFDYGMPETEEPDAPLIEQIGKAHLGVIGAAFQCDLLRVATFQWTASQPKLSIAGLDPEDPGATYMHHPLSHRNSTSSLYLGSPPTSGDDAFLYEAMVRANAWYFERYAEVFAEWKSASDGFGHALLDRTVIPLVTEVAHPAHARSPLAALILGGRALGMQGGQYKDFQGSARLHNDLWLTVAQAFFPDSPNVLDEMPGEVFVRDGVAPIEGLWRRPT